MKKGTYFLTLLLQNLLIVRKEIDSSTANVAYSRFLSVNEIGVSEEYFFCVYLSKVISENLGK